MEFQLIDPAGVKTIKGETAELVRQWAITGVLIKAGAANAQAQEAYLEMSREERIVFWKGLQLAGWKLQRVRA